MELLRRVASQTMVPDMVVVVDNGSDARLKSALGSSIEGLPIRYMDPGSNLGPAGAFHHGLRALADHLDPDDIIVHFDDDDPPVSADQLRSLVSLLKAERASGRSVGGVGLSGGRLNRLTGRVTRVSGDIPVEQVDHLHGGYLPMYSAEALLDVGETDPSYFFGFEELELGRRLHGGGWTLLVANRLMGEVEHLYPKRTSVAQGRFRIDARDLGWSRFHKERNLIRILRREGLWWAILMTVTSRHLLKPAVVLLWNPRVAARRMVLGVRASVAGLAGRGGIDHRYPPPAHPEDHDIETSPEGGG